MADNERLRELAESDIDELTKLLRSLEGKVVRPHPAQRVVLDSSARFKIMNCGRRFGKTKLAAKILTEKSRQPNQVLWWVAPTYKVVKRGYAEVLRQLPDGMLTHHPPPESNFDAGRAVILRFKNGTKMEFYSAERPEGMLGEGVDYVVMDEAAIMPSRIWNQVISPTLMDREGGALMISTPRGRNWFYKVWLMGQDPDRHDWESWTFPSSSNPTLPEGEVERMKGSMPRLEYEQEVEAKFLAAGSSVFYIDERCIQREAIVMPNGLIENYPPKGFVVLGVDLAKTNDWTVFYGCRASDRRNCYFERMQAVTWPEQKRRLRRAVRRLMQAGASGVMMVMDSTGVGDPIVDDMEADGFDVVGLNFTTHKANMVKLLSKDLEEGQAFILEDGMDEFSSYAMTLSPSGRLQYSAPEGEHDDIVCSKMLSHWGCVNEGVPEIQIIGPSEVSPSDDTEPWMNDGELEDYSDLLDDDGAADVEIGLPRSTGPPTPEELLLHPDAWF